MGAGVVPKSLEIDHLLTEMTIHEIKDRKSMLAEDVM